MSIINKDKLVGVSPNSRLFKEYQDSLKALSVDQWEASIGLVLGDVSLQTQNKGKTFRIKFEWSEKSKAYLDHVYDLFSEWVISEPHRKARLSPKGNLVVNYGFQTISLEAFNHLAELFILNNKKSVPEGLITNHLTGRGLAYWFMDDGSKLDYNKNSKNKSIVLNTHSFTELEVHRMAKELSLKFNFNIHLRSNKGKKVIVINNESYPLFRELINPNMIPEMRYKLP